ncbi:MAG: DUF3990 domain-containing protein [Faecousia sp.]
MIRIILYHGTLDRYAYDIIRNGINLEKSKPNLDFGPGFYTTPDKEFAINTAKFHQAKFNAMSKKEHVGWRVVELECDDKMFSQFNCKCFDSPDEEWGKFVISNRCKNKEIHNTSENNIDKRYDIVSGPTADGKGTLAPVIKAVDSGDCTLDDIDFASFAPPSSKNWGNQISFHTNESLSCITVKGVIQCQYGEV